MIDNQWKSKELYRKLQGKSKSEHHGNISPDIPRNMTKDTLFSQWKNIFLIRVKKWEPEKPPLILDVYNYNTISQL